MLTLAQEDRSCFHYARYDVAVGRGPQIPAQWARWRAGRDDYRNGLLPE